MSAVGIPAHGSRFHQLVDLLGDRVKIESVSIADRRIIVQMLVRDIGDPKDIHPKNKQDVAKRLARWALVETYKVPGITVRSPRYKAMEKQGSKIVLSFDDVEAKATIPPSFDPVTRSVPSNSQGTASAATTS